MTDRGAPSSHDCDTRGTAAASPPARRSWPPCVPWRPPSPRADEEIELARDVPADIIEDLQAAGMITALLPRSHGGSGLTIPEAMPILTELAQADASVAWTAGILGGAWIDTTHLPRATFDSLYAEGPVMIAGHSTRAGWPCVRGRATASTAAGPSPAAAITPSGSSVTAWRSDGQGPQIRTVLLRPDEVEIEDTWTVSGLCGTGSHHFSVHDLVVPAADGLPLR